MRWRTSSRIFPAISVCDGESCRLSKKCLRVGDGEGGGLADVLVVDEDGAGFGAEALAAAVGAEGVAAVFGEEDADVELVFFALERGEEAADAGEAAAAVFDEALLLGGEIVPGDVGGDAWRLWRRGSSRRGGGGTWWWSRGRWRLGRGSSTCRG